MAVQQHSKPVFTVSVLCFLSLIAGFPRGGGAVSTKETLRQSAPLDIGSQPRVDKGLPRDDLSVADAFTRASHEVERVESTIASLNSRLDQQHEDVRTLSSRALQDQSAAFVAAYIGRIAMTVISCSGGVPSIELTCQAGGTFTTLSIPNFDKLPHLPVCEDRPDHQGTSQGIRCHFPTVPTSGKSSGPLSVLLIAGFICSGNSPEQMFAEVGTTPHEFNCDNGSGRALSTVALHLSGDNGTHSSDTVCSGGFPSVYYEGNPGLPTTVCVQDAVCHSGSSADCLLKTTGVRTIQDAIPEISVTPSGFFTRAPFPSPAPEASMNGTRTNQQVRYTINALTYISGNHGTDPVIEFGCLGEGEISVYYFTRTFGGFDHACNFVNRSHYRCSMPTINALPLEPGQALSAIAVFMCSGSASGDDLFAEARLLPQTLECPYQGGEVCASRHYISLFYTDFASPRDEQGRFQSSFDCYSGDIKHASFELSPACLQDNSCNADFSSCVFTLEEVRAVQRNLPATAIHSGILYEPLTFYFSNHNTHSLNRMSTRAPTPSTPMFETRPPYSSVPYTNPDGKARSVLYSVLFSSRSHGCRGWNITFGYGCLSGGKVRRVEDGSTTDKQFYTHSPVCETAASGSFVECTFPTIHEDIVYNDTKFASNAIDGFLCDGVDETELQGVAFASGQQLSCDAAYFPSFQESNFIQLYLRTRDIPTYYMLENQFDCLEGTYSAMLDETRAPNCHSSANCLDPTGCSLLLESLYAQRSLPIPPNSIGYLYEAAPGKTASALVPSTDLQHVVTESPSDLSSLTTEPFSYLPSVSPSTMPGFQFDGDRGLSAEQSSSLTPFRPSNSLICLVVVLPQMMLML